MKRYYASRTLSKEGFYEVHRQGCDSLPEEECRVFLGIWTASNYAVDVAQNLFKRVCPCSCCLATAVANIESSNHKQSLKLNR